MRPANLMLGIRYKESLTKWAKRYQRDFGQQRVDYVRLFTTTPYDVALFRYLEKRRKLY